MMNPFMRIAQALRRFLGRRRLQSEPPRVEYSYTVFWRQTAREWPAERRNAVETCVQALISQPGFAPNPFERRYQVEGLEGAHSGASLAALAKVLESLRQS